jgi:hypothetical protein
MHTHATPVWHASSIPAIAALPAAGILLCVGGPAGAQQPPAEFFNEFDYAPTAPTPGPTNFEIVFAGNVTCKIPPQNQLDTSTDPFPNPNPITIVYDNAPNTTTVTFSGSPLVPGQRYHFGLNQGFAPTPALQVVAKTWTYAAAPASPLPIVNVATNPGTGPFKYQIIYVEASFNPPGQGVTYGSWYEMPYTPSPSNPIATPAITYMNYNAAGLPIYITTSGIRTGLAVPSSAGTLCSQSPVCKANTKLLNRLDFKYEPPPGQKGSRFVPIDPPPPAMLQASQPNNTSFTCP